MNLFINFKESRFSELLERVRSIRASERRIWQQITDICAKCSMDYVRKKFVSRPKKSTKNNKN